MASQITDEPVVQLQALERALGALTAKETAAYGGWWEHARGPRYQGTHAGTALPLSTSCSA
jgi:hypothetical protein